MEELKALEDEAAAIDTELKTILKSWGYDR
jgi:hypothetical protein